MSKQVKCIRNVFILSFIQEPVTIQTLSCNYKTFSPPSPLFALRGHFAYFATSPNISLLKSHNKYNKHDICSNFTNKIN